MKEVRRELAQQVWHQKSQPVAESRFHTLFVRNPQPMWIYDVKTLRVLDVNQAALDRYGYTREQFLELTIKDLRPAEDVPKFLELIVDLPYSDRTGPWRHRLSDGTVIHVLITSHSVRYGETDARLVLAENMADEPDLDLP